LKTVISNKINIITSNSTPRLVYTLDFIFNQFFDCGYQISAESHPDLVNISYENGHNNEDFPSLNASSYLFETHILPAPETINPDSPSFDLFGFVFYFLSRAEEYQFHSQDSFNRFTSSDAHFGHDVAMPLVDIHLLTFAEKLHEKFNIKLLRNAVFKLIHTVDIDQFYAFKNKSLKRTVGGLVSSTLKANISDLKDRKKSLSEGIDPYDTFNFLQEHSAEVESHYFVLVGSYDKIDNALDINQKEIKEQLKELAENANIGLHPSIKSGESFSVLQSEKEKIEQVMSSNIRESRQHFLKLNFPKTFNDLLEVGIKKDHSLGYHDAIGFRAGTSNPFYWFDLSKNKATELMVQPLVVMDVTLKKYLNLQPEEAIKQVKKVIDQCREVQAPFSLLWHNSSFYEQEGWAGWKEVYLAIINYCRELSA